MAIAASWIHVPFESLHLLSFHIGLSFAFFLFIYRVGTMNANEREPSVCIQFIASMYKTTSQADTSLTQANINKKKPFKILRHMELIQLFLSIRRHHSKIDDRKQKH